MCIETPNIYIYIYIAGGDFMCVLSIKVPTRKKSGNLFDDLVYIYIYIYIRRSFKKFIYIYIYIYIYTYIYIYI